MRVFLVGGLTPRIAALFHCTGTEILHVQAKVDERNVLSVGDRLFLSDAGQFTTVPDGEPALGVASNPLLRPSHPARLWPAMVRQIEILAKSNPKGLA